MRPREAQDSGQHDLLRARLDQIIDVSHALTKLARTTDWRFLGEQLGAVYTQGLRMKDAGEDLLHVLVPEELSSIFRTPKSSRQTLHGFSLNRPEFWAPGTRPFKNGV